MTAKIIDGSLIAKKIKIELKDFVDHAISQSLRPPYLVVVLVGDDPPSQIYVARKEQACAEVGIKSHACRLPSDVSQEELEEILKNFSSDPKIDGILLQLPLPKGLNADKALRFIDVNKDVDGLSALNQGLLALGQDGLFSCTPLGCIELIKSTGINIAGKKAVVIGRSALVGAPVAVMLTQLNATVTTIHSKTIDPELVAKEADILVVAAGKMHLVDSKWVKPQAVVIDVGIHRNGSKLAGDVDFESVSQVASFISPVPGGVGPMTIAMLLKNTIKAYKINALNH